MGVAELTSTIALYEFEISACKSDLNMVSQKDGNARYEVDHDAEEEPQDGPI